MPKFTAFAISLALRALVFAQALPAGAQAPPAGAQAPPLGAKGAAKGRPAPAAPGFAVHPDGTVAFRLRAPQATTEDAQPGIDLGDMPTRQRPPSAGCP